MDIKAKEGLLNDIRPALFKIARGFSFKGDRLDEARCEDLVQEVSLKVLKEIEGGRVENIMAWAKSVARNLCIDIYRKEKKRVEFNAHSFDDDIETDHLDKTPRNASRIEDPILDRIDDDLIIEQYKKSISEDLRKKIDMSVEYIAELFRLKEEIRPLHDKYLRASTVIDNVKSEFEFLVGRKRLNDWENDPGDPMDQLINKVFSVAFLKKPIDEKKLDVWKPTERPTEDGCSVLCEAYGELCELLDRLKGGLKEGAQSILFKSCIGYLLPYDIHKSLKFIKEFRIKPPRLLYDIWKNAEGLKKGEYINIKRMRLIFEYHRIKFSGTSKEGLFRGVEKGGRNIYTIRRSSYKETTNQRIYNKFILAIHRRSFINAIPPSDHVRLFEQAHKEGWKASWLDDVDMRLNVIYSTGYSGFLDDES